MNQVFFTMTSTKRDHSISRLRVPYAKLYADSDKKAAALTNFMSQIKLEIRFAYLVRQDSVAKTLDHVNECVLQDSLVVPILLGGV